jgi:hypothetical protein
MSWSPRVDLFLDVSDSGEAVLLDFGSSTTGDRTRGVSWYLADCFDLRIFLIDRVSDARASVTLGGTDQLVLAAKKLTSSVPGGSVVFNADTWTSSTASVNGVTLTYYQATLDLNTTELSTALGSAASIEVQVDLEIQTAGNAKRITRAFDVTILAQSYAGEGSPTPGTPVYPAPSALITTSQLSIPAGMRLRIDASGSLIVETIS